MVKEHAQDLVVQTAHILEFVAKVEMAEVALVNDRAYAAFRCHPVDLLEVLIDLGAGSLRGILNGGEQRINLGFGQLLPVQARLPPDAVEILPQDLV